MQRNPVSIVALSLLLSAGVILSGFPPGAPSHVALADTANASPLYGDITGDGVVDGKDALRIARIVEGLIQPTTTDLQAGDVYPFPGSGRRLGDGQLTRDDALRILRYAVGLVSPEALQGDTLPPIGIRGLDPSEGPPGTVVTINGTGFIAGATMDHVVMFGEVQAVVLEVGESSIKATVPAAARTGFVTVASPAGLARSPGKFTVTQLLAGSLSLPAGMNPQEFTVISPWDGAVPGASGAFQLAADQGQVFVLFALPNSEGHEQVFMGLHVPPSGVSTPTLAPAVIDSLSTAVGMVFITPYFATRDPLDAARVKRVAEDDPKVAALAALIDRKYVTVPDPWADDEILNAWREAVASVAASLPGTDVVIPARLGSAPGSPQTAEAGTPKKGAQMATVRSAAAVAIPLTLATDDPAGQGAILYPVDISGLRVTVSDLSLGAETVYSNPMDWVVRVNEIDLSRYDGGIAGIWAAGTGTVFPVRADGFRAVSNAGAQSVFSAFDLIGELNDFLYEAAFGEAAESIVLPDREGMYEIRMYSGALKDGEDEGELRTAWESIYGARDDITFAVILNLSQAMFDFVDLMGLEVGSWDSKAKEEIISNVSLEMIRAFNVEFQAGVWGRSGIDILWSAGAVAEAGLKELFEQIESYLIKRILFRPGRVARAAEKLEILHRHARSLGRAANKALFYLELFDKIGKVGKIAERLLGIAGFAPTMAANNMKLSPMETVIVVVGDPVNPQIDSIIPAASGYAGDQLTLRGRRLGEDASRVRVGFLGQVVRSARPDSVSSDQTRLTVRVPRDLMPGSYSLVVQTPRGNNTANPPNFTILDTPIITDVRPDKGFAASSGFPHAGDVITISGAGFSAQDVVTFGGGAETTPLATTPNAMRVRIPAGAQTGTLKVTSAKSGRSADGPVVQVYGPPQVTGISPATGPVGTMVTVDGANFGVSPDTVRAYASNGQPLAVERAGNTRLEVRMVTGSEAGALTVTTPAGSITTPAFALTPGRARGSDVSVTVAAWGGDAETDPQINFNEALRIMRGERLPYRDPRNTDDDPDNDVPDEWQTNGGGRDTVWRFGPDYANALTFQVAGSIALPAGIVLDQPYDTVRARWPLVVQLSGGSFSVEAEGITLDNLSLSNAPGNGIALNFATGATLSQIRVTGAGGDGIHISGGGGHSLDFVSVYDSQGDGLEITGGAFDLRISGGVYAGNAGNGIWVHGNRTRNISTLANVVVGAKVGADGTWTRAGNGGDGILISEGASGITLGGTSVANAGDGVKITGGSTSDVRLLGLHAGILYRGPYPGSRYWAMGNGGNGLAISGGARNVQVMFGFQSRPRFGSNGGHGLYISGAGTGNISVEQSDIGIDIEGKGKYGNMGSGIAIAGDASGSPSDISFYVNYIGDNKQYGVLLSGAAAPAEQPIIFTWTRNGHFGSGLEDVSDRAPNTLGSWRLENGTRNIIIRGGEYVGSPVGLWLDGENTAYNSQSRGHIAATTGAAIRVTNGAHHNQFLGVEILDNLGDGIVIDSSHDNTIGLLDRQESWDPPGMWSGLWEREVLKGSITGNAGNGIIVRGGASRNVIREQVIDSNTGDGVKLSPGEGGKTPDRTLIESSIVGSVAVETGTDGGSIVAEPNGGAGVRITGASDTLLKDNHFMVNNGPGILVEGATTNSTRIVGNKVGRTDTAMAPTDGNGQAGIRVSGGARNTIIGGYMPGERNIISGNKGPGIWASGANTTGLRILDNYIGTSPDGLSDAGNEGDGIRVDGVGDVVIRNGNVIAGNTGDGIHLSGSVTRGATIDGNVIGARADRTGALRNDGYGIRIDGGSGENRLRVNEIVAAGLDGIQVAGGSLNRIVNNSIGVSGDGALKGTIGGHGILLTGHTNDNAVAFNIIRSVKGHGIAIGDAANALDAPIGNALSGNSIAGSGGKAIALLTSGAQEGIQAPVLISVQNMRVYGQAPGAPGGSVVELFADSADEAQFPFGTARVDRGEFDYRGPVPAGFNISATVTDLYGNTSELGTGGNFNLHPLPQPVLFVSTRDWNREIYRLTSVLGAAVRLTRDPADDIHPALSSDGGRIAFSSNRGGTYNIYLMDMEGGTTINVTSSVWNDFLPAWSPDGQTIAFVSDRDGKKQIYLIGASGDNITRLTDNSAADTDPVWSSQGDRILFASDRSGNMDIWIVDTDGTNLRQLTTDGAADYKPAWSPGGSKIAFVSERDGNPEIYVMDAGSGNLTRLTDNPAADVDPAWSREGDKILFASNRDEGMEIYSASSNGSRVIRLTSSLGDNTQPNLAHPAGVPSVQSASVTNISAGAGIQQPLSAHAAQPGGQPSLTTATRAGFSATSGSRSYLTSGEASNITLELRIESGTATPGSTVSLKVDLLDARDLGNLAFDIVYDRSKLELLAVTPGEVATAEKALFALNPEVFPGYSGLIRFQWVRPTGFSGGGNVLTLALRVKTHATEGTIPVVLQNLSAADVNLADTAVAGQDGAVTVRAILLGDATGDGKVDALDITKVERIIADLDAPAPGADANLDGKVDAIDITEVERRIAGLD